MHENPIAPVHHLSGDLRITGLIRVPEIPSAQIKKVKDETDENRDQLDTSLLLYLALAYTLGVFVQTVSGLRITDFRKHTVATNAGAERKEADRD